MINAWQRRTTRGARCPRCLPAPDGSRYAAPRDPRRAETPGPAPVQAAAGTPAVRPGAGQEPAVPAEAAGAGLTVRVERRPFDRLPGAARAAVDTRVGAGCPATDMTTGESSGVATLLFLPDGTKVFVKGLPENHERAGELETEIRVSASLPPYAPRLLWHTWAGGWRLLGFEGVTATPWADFTADGNHLEPVAAVLRDLSTRPAPDTVSMTAWDRWGSYCDPEDEPLLQGGRLLHTDPVATNFLIDIDADRAWLVDWAWAARGPGWIDTALWGLRLVLDGGQTPEQAAQWAATVPAFAHAPPRAVHVLAEAEARSWEHWQAYGTEGLGTTVRAARTWADFWARQH